MTSNRNWWGSELPVSTLINLFGFGFMCMWCLFKSGVIIFGGELGISWVRKGPENKYTQSS